MEELLSLDVSSRHSIGPENKRVLFCFVFSDSCFSVEGSLPRIALPLEPGCEHKAQRAGSSCVPLILSATPCPPPPSTCSEEKRELRLQGC